MHEAQTKREAAEILLGELFADRSRITISDAAAAGNERGISRRTLSRVGSQMGIRAVLNGSNGGIWERVPE